MITGGHHAGILYPLVIKASDIYNMFFPARNLHWDRGFRNHIRLPLRFIVCYIAIIYIIYIYICIYTKWMACFNHIHIYVYTYLNTNYVFLYSNAVYLHDCLYIYICISWCLHMQILHIHALHIHKFHTLHIHTHTYIHICLCIYRI